MVIGINFVFMFIAIRPVVCDNKKNQFKTNETNHFYSCSVLLNIFG